MTETYSRSSGDNLGPYTVLAALGSGGMGEVYRARDGRLGREVALKLLRPGTDSDPERLRRFEQEARAASSIEHPAVVRVYDVSLDGAPRYLVMELLEGESLRARLDRGPLPPSDLLRFARQLADGLAAAHGRGVIHRDLKPENLFITRDGQLKILDFGIARLGPEGASAPVRTVSDVGTSPGSILGTAGYMSPEQVRGQDADLRTDVFSLGAILYEMATGQRAFPGDTAIDRALAIVSAEPPPITRTDLPRAFPELVRACLAKSPADRLQSARDLGRFLGALDTTGRDPAVPAIALPSLPHRWTRIRLAWAWGASILVVLMLRAALARQEEKPPPARFERITFQPGAIGNARFAPDGKNVLFTRRLGLDEPRIYTVLPGLPETRAITEPGVSLQAVSRQGELLVSVVSSNGPGRATALARMTMAGTAPRRMIDAAWGADWTPNGAEAAAVVITESGLALEFPIGHRVYAGSSGMGTPRVSPDGKYVAFTDHPQGRDDMGYVKIASRTGEIRRLTPLFGTLQGLAWMPDGDEIVFTGALEGAERSFFFVDLDGNLRPGPTAPVDMTVLDVDLHGTILLKRSLAQVETLGRAGDRSPVQNLRLFDRGIPAGITDDGRHYTFVEGGAAGGAQYFGYYRSLSDRPPIRLGSGRPIALSGDGRRVLMFPENDRSRLTLVPTEVGSPTLLPAGPIQSYDAAVFLPDGKRAVIAGRDQSGEIRLFVQSLDPVLPPEYSAIQTRLSANATIDTSPSGEELALWTERGRIRRFDLATGDEKPVIVLNPGELPLRWSKPDQFLVLSTTVTPSRTEAGARRLEAIMTMVSLSSGAREERHRLSDEDGGDLPISRNVSGLAEAVVSRSGDAFVLAVETYTSDLYLLHLDGH